MIVIDLLDPDTDLDHARQLVREHTVQRESVEVYDYLADHFRVAYDDSLDEQTRAQRLYDISTSMADAAGEPETAPDTPEEALARNDMSDIFGLPSHEHGKIIHLYVFGADDVTLREAERARRNLLDAVDEPTLTARFEPAFD